MYRDYETLTKQAAQALRRAEYDFAKELLRNRHYPHNHDQKKRAELSG